MKIRKLIRIPIGSRIFGHSVVSIILFLLTSHTVLPEKRNIKGKKYFGYRNIRENVPVLQVIMKFSKKTKKNENFHLRNCDYLK
jgi:hypothetical protein